MAKQYIQLLRAVVFTAACALVLPAGALAQSVTVVNEGDTETETITATGDVTIEKGGTLNTGVTPAVMSGVEGSTVSNNGAITAGVGVIATSVDMTVTNGATGTIIATICGIAPNGDGATVSNSGTITVTGTSAQGICSTAGDGTTVTNEADGTIITTGGNASGILTQGANTTVINEVGGTITTTGRAPREVRREVRTQGSPIAAPSPPRAAAHEGLRTTAVG